MKTTVPSLIASSTLGIAAAGLALGKQETSIPQGIRDAAYDSVKSNYQTSSSPRRRRSSVSSFWECVFDCDNQDVSRDLSSATTPHKYHRRPPLTHVNKTFFTPNQRPSSLRISDSTNLSVESSPEENKKRDSISSRGSWIKRLSNIPVCHTPNHDMNSECHSVQSNSCHPWCAPIQYSFGNSQTPLPRKRLTKKSLRGRAASDVKSQIKSQSKATTTPRRPVTSHHRSIFSSDNSPYRCDNVEHMINDKTPSMKKGSLKSRQIWHLYLDSRKNQASKERASKTHLDINKPLIMTNWDSMGTPTLVKPNMITSLRGRNSFEDKCLICEANPSKNQRNMNMFIKQDSSSANLNHVKNIGHSQPIKASFAFRVASLRGLKRNRTTGSRNRSASETPRLSRSDQRSLTAHGETKINNLMRDRMTIYHQRESSDVVLNDDLPWCNEFLESPLTRKHNSSSPSLLPLPSLSQVSSFCLDLSRQGLPTSPPGWKENQTFLEDEYLPTRKPHTEDPNTFSTTTPVSSPQKTCFSVTDESKNNGLTEIVDRTSTLIGSEYDVKRFVSLGDEDLDFQSETVFDSWRSGSTGMIQPPKLSLESMFEDAIPIEEENKSLLKKITHALENQEEFPLLCQEVLGNDDISTTNSPGRGPSPSLEKKCLEPCNLVSAITCREILASPVLNICLPRQNADVNVNYDNDDDDDDNYDDKYDDHEDDNYVDWTGIGELHEPKLKYSPSFMRTSYATTSENHGTDGYLNNVDSLSNTTHNRLYHPDTPKTNIFDWSEPSSLEKLDFNGNSPRPKTTQNKQIMDIRSSRALKRHCSHTSHNRSQSVPVVPGTDISKISKFGTWGLGSKGISEDWDGDFEFDNIDSDDLPGENLMKGHGVLVPEAIKASQENIAGHVGQIREVCLLVEELKRQRDLGESQGLLDGEFYPLWQQAEGIIALAAPVEEKVVEEIDTNTRSSNLDELCDCSCDSPDLASLIELNNHHIHHQSTNKENKENSDKEYHSVAHQLISQYEPNFLMSTMNTQDSPQYLPKDPFQSVSNTTCHPHTQSEVARKVMESMHQQRSPSDPLSSKKIPEIPGSKMPFDTTSLKDLVNRATALCRALSQITRSVDGQCSASSSRPHDSSPAFTRVFTDPAVIPPNLSPSQSSSRSKNSGPIDTSPIQGLPQRLRMTAVV